MVNIQQFFVILLSIEHSNIINYALHRLFFNSSKLAEYGVQNHFYF